MSKKASASRYFNQQPRVVHLSFSFSFLQLELRPLQLSADCCAVCFTSTDVIISHVCQMEMRTKEEQEEIFCIHYISLFNLSVFMQ